jgi:hypothetical protein
VPNVIAEGYRPFLGSCSLIRPELPGLVPGAGVILGAAAVTCLALGAISAQQAIAIGLPGVLLIVAGLIFVVPDRRLAGGWAWRPVSMWARF